jgi:hypothetical protein
MGRKNKCTSAAIQNLGVRAQKKIQAPARITTHNTMASSGTGDSKEAYTSSQPCQNASTTPCNQMEADDVVSQVSTAWLITMLE